MSRRRNPSAAASLTEGFRFRSTHPTNWINLPEIGITGNSHMLMQDKNNGEIAEVIHVWLAGKGFLN